MRLQTINVLCLLVASPALAAVDLSVSITPPGPTYVYQAGTHTVEVSNIGNQNSSTVSLTIQLPQTHTSPTVHVLGTLGAHDSRCTLSGTRLLCSLASIRKRNSTNVSFTITLPQSAAPIQLTATASTSGEPANKLGNNSASHTASQLFYSAAVNGPRGVHNRHCTGTNLISFFECELYPSSISFHDVVLEAGGTITFTQPGYSGTWTQLDDNSQPDTRRLQLKYYDGATLAADFDGYGVGTNNLGQPCFEGLTVFPNSPYVAPYEVCLQ